MDSVVARTKALIVGRTTVRDQVRRLTPAVVVTGVVASAGVLAFRTLSRRHGVPIQYLTRDPAATTDSLWSLGAQSNVGIMMWAAAAAVPIVAGLLLWGVAQRRRASLFLLTSGLLSLLLALDDALLLHEKVLPNGLGIPEGVVYAGYVVIIVAYLAYNALQILRTDYLLLGAALVFSAGSIAADILDLHVFVEDGLKFYGIVFWLVYYARTSMALLREGLRPPADVG